MIYDWIDNDKENTIGNLYPLAPRNQGMGDFRKPSLRRISKTGEKQL